MVQSMFYGSTISGLHADALNILWLAQNIMEEGFNVVNEYFG